MKTSQRSTGQDLDHRNAHPTGNRGIERSPDRAARRAVYRLAALLAAPLVALVLATTPSCDRGAGESGHDRFDPDVRPASDMDHHDPGDAAHRHEASANDRDADAHDHDADMHDHDADVRTSGSGPDGAHHPVVELSATSARLAEIAVAPAAVGTLEIEIRVPGEIGYNEDRLAHVAPRFEGIVRGVSGRVGSGVREGQELARIESNSSLSEYPLLSPIDGTIVEKHITPGEFVSQDSNLFTIADLSTVWVDLDVPAKYVGSIRAGQRFRLENLGGDLHAVGLVDYTAPILHETTRAGLARIVLPNPGGEWRPGTFVTGRARLDAAGPTVLIHRDAVQLVDDEPVVFVPLGDGRYGATPIETGLSNRDQTQVLAGLEAGSTYVCTGAFELKAMLMMSALGGHAGHGH